jgi:D-lyxose ketol-isomerase
MITHADEQGPRLRAAGLIHTAGFVVRAEEIASIECADFGLGNLLTEGAQILTLAQSPRLAAKLIVLFPGQTLPEHWHPPVGDDPGKEETIRVFLGSMFIGLPGEGEIQATIPRGKEPHYTCRHERLLIAGEQCYLPPGTRHWFQGGPEGVVAGSFSSVAYDILDRFTDPGVIRRQR